MTLRRHQMLHCLCLLACYGLLAAQDVTARDRSVVIVTDATGANGHALSLPFDGSRMKNMQAELVRPPAHGEITFDQGWLRFTYTCSESPGFSGTDSFDYRFTGDDGTTNVATVHLLLRAAADPGGAKVFLVVRPHLVTALGPELQRLAEDLREDGYTAVIRTANPSNWDDLTSLLQGYHGEPGFTSGCILIGDFPIYKLSREDQGDEPLFNITRTNDYHEDIWVSRMSYGSRSDYGDEVTLLRRHLDANHGYRRGLLRPPHFFTLFEGFQYMTYDPAHENLSSLWPDYLEGFDTTARATMAMGASFHQNHGHGSNSGYELGVSGGEGMSKGKAFSVGNRIAMLIIGSCSSGGRNGIACYQTATLDGFNVLSVGNTKEASSSMFIHESDDPHTAFRERLQAGDCYGSSLAEIHGSHFFKQYRFYGDMSLRVTPAPHNEMPTITSLDADRTTIQVGESVQFTVNASDADGAISHVHWWPIGFHYGLAPAQRSDDGTFSWSYDAPGSYRVRARVFDDYRCHVDAEITITVEGTAANQPPVVRLLTPARELSLAEDEGLRINAWAQDLDGSVATVRFLVDDEEIGTDSKAPYDHTWTASGPGSHVIRVEAVDDDGAVGASHSQTVHVREGQGGQAPLVYLQVQHDGSELQLEASATDLDGSVVEVVFLLDGTELGQATEEPWSHSTTTASLSGTVNLQARAVDDDGLWSLSQAVQLRISELARRLRAEAGSDGGPLPVEIRVQPGDLILDAIDGISDLDPYQDHLLQFERIDGNH